MNSRPAPRSLTNRISLMKFLKKWLGRYISEYLNTTVIYLMDVFLSVAASGVVVLFAIVFTAYDPQPDFILYWLLFSAVASLLMFYLARSYKVIIRHSTLKDLGKYTLTFVGKEALMLLALSLVPGYFEGLLAFILLDFFVGLFFVLIVRVLMVTVYDQMKKNNVRRRNCINILVYGTSDKSVAIATRLSNSPHYRVVGFLSEGDVRDHIMLSDFNVFHYGDEKSFDRMVNDHNVSGLLFATEKEAQRMQDLIQHAARNKVKILLSPTIDEMVGGRLVHNRVREIKIEDLLGREEIKISMDEIIENFRGKTVMVTGAAGSIGSELCRQLAGFGVRMLVLYDNAETPMHNLRLELEERFPELKFVPIIGDVRMPTRLDYAFRSWKPQVVFHAAAYKHVPLMEENPCEAVLANVAGTRNVADKCIEYGVEKMVMISTDKAVNPTNIMGCTKRLAEIYVQSLGLAIEEGVVKGTTKFVTTRFGNVLGSNGSVIPRFREQIENGGPVTVTDKNIIRFFMTIPEACRLVMEAATMATENRICVFDMGEPVKIDHLARRMIELAGFVPDKDIKIEYTGLRPGEKLYEEVLSNAENTLPTSHDRIRIAKVRDYDYKSAAEYADRLAALAVKVDIPAMVRLMKEIVPEFKSRNSEFEKYDK